MVYSVYKKQCILFHHYLKRKPYTIQRLLLEENLPCSRWGIAKFLKRFEQDGVLVRRLGSGRPFKATAVVKADEADGRAVKADGRADEAR